MKKTLGIASVIAISASLGISGAWAQQNVEQPGHVSPTPGTSNDTMSATKDTAGHAMGTISAEMTSTLKGFVTAAAISDMYEVEAGKIAAQRSKNKEVRDFAAKMVKGHTQTTDELKTLLRDDKANVTPPTQLDDRHQAMLDELRGAKGSDFDNRYISQQIDAHKEALILMRGYAKDGDVASIQSFATKTVPVVQAHLDMAQRLDSAINKNS